MKDLSFTQEFFMCALKAKGTFTNATESSVCLLAGALLELLMDGYIEIDDQKKKVLVKEVRLPEKAYLSSIYESIKNNKPMTMEKIAEKYAFDFKMPDELFLLVGNSLEEYGYVVKETGKGLFKNKVSFIPYQIEVTKIIEKLRAEFLEHGKISDEVVILGALLNKSGLIKKFFSKYEVEKLNERLAEVRQSEAGVLINKLIDYIDTWIVLISVIGS